MSDGDNNVTIDVSILPNEVEVVCAEEREDDICRTRVGVVKRTEVGTLFVPVSGPTFYLGEWRLPHPPNEPVPRASCPYHGWVTTDEDVLLKAGNKPGTPTVWAHTLGLR
jgi:hypothetical protein